MDTVVLENVGTQEAHGFVTDIRDFHEDVIVFDRSGAILASRAEDGGCLEGDSIKSYMSVSEWEFLRKNCISYACARTVVDTRFGVMLVFCNMVASMNIMVGVIFKEDRNAAAHYFRGKITMVDMLSPRVKAMALRGREQADEQALVRLDEIAHLAFSAFATAGLRRELEVSLLQSTSCLIRRICLLARMIGCRVNCRSTRDFPPRTEDFSGDAFVAMMLSLLFFVYKNCPSRAAEIEIGDFDARPRIVLRCEMPNGEREVFVNRRYRYSLLDLCDRLAAKWGFPFECSVYAEGMNPRLRVAFCPRVRSVEGLRVKEPPRKLDYSDAGECVHFKSTPNSK